MGPHDIAHKKTCNRPDRATRCRNLHQPIPPRQQLQRIQRFQRIHVHVLQRRSDRISPPNTRSWIRNHTIYILGTTGMPVIGSIIGCPGGIIILEPDGCIGIPIPPEPGIIGFICNRCWCWLINSFALSTFHPRMSSSVPSTLSRPADHIAGTSVPVWLRPKIGRELSYRNRYIQVHRKCETMPACFPHAGLCQRESRHRQTP